MNSKSIINYYNKISQYKRFGGTRNESSLRRAFENLLEDYCLPKKLVLIDEIQLKNSTKRPDGTVKDGNQLDWGFWESKDPKDNLDIEIEKKIEIGYPTFNILFENSEQIVLIQKSNEVMRGEIENADFLHRILTCFTEYERPEITEFRKAVEKFKEDIPDIVEALRAMIEEQTVKNLDFKINHDKFWKLCRESINQEISNFDIREMLIQHILTAEIFDTVFGDSHFHRENNIARELEIVVNTFFTGTVRRNLLSSIDNYYKTIKREASNITNHHEKQKFLKINYENFYKAYNPKGADKLGVVYTPNEIVKFMVESTDFLLEKHFGKSLADKNVQILDPATGTGTFITEIIEYIPEQYLEEKYQNEIHCNELAILPYYIANLNIEYTYQQKMNLYKPFNNIVFVDTLDNLGFRFVGKQQKMYGMTTDNLERIINQNDKKISVIIGNPPYNANQQNENDNNKNRIYKELDKRIKATYIEQSKAQKSKVYDMYARFYRWASDRINQNGIVAFITNRSFIDSRTFDGFRKTMLLEFDYAYVIDLHGDIRTDSNQSKANVFNIMTGVAIAFFIKKEKTDSKFLKYYSLDYPTAKEKLDFLKVTPLKSIPFESISPTESNNWINIADNNFETLMPLIDKANKLSKNINNKNVLFYKYSNGINTSRDEWVYDFDKTQLTNKINYFYNEYNSFVGDWKNYVKEKKLANKKSDELMKIASEFVFSKDFTIKWSGRLFRDKLLKFRTSKFKSEFIRTSHYRPFTKKHLYSDYIPIDIQGQIFDFFPKGKQNKIIAFSTLTNQLQCLSSDIITSLDFLTRTVCIPLYRYDSKGNRLDNITEWGLKQFKEHYNNTNITNEDVFYYTYAVFHNPEYVKKYELNLNREFPRIPFYKNFSVWVNRGRELMNLHIGYETSEPYDLRVSYEEIKVKPKTKLKALPESGEIILDENTTISGIPFVAWKYKFGNRSALHWILDQYKEKNSSDKTIEEKFDDYLFANYKTSVIDLIQRITTVSVRTIEIINQMQIEKT